MGKDLMQLDAIGGVRLELPTGIEGAELLQIVQTDERLSKLFVALERDGSLRRLLLLNKRDLFHF